MDLEKIEKLARKAKKEPDEHKYGVTYDIETARAIYQLLNHVDPMIAKLKAAEELIKNCDAIMQEIEVGLDPNANQIQKKCCPNYSIE